MKGLLSVSQWAGTDYEGTVSMRCGFRPYLRGTIGISPIEWLRWDFQGGTFSPTLLQFLHTTQQNVHIIGTAWLRRAALWLALLLESAISPNTCSDCHWDSVLVVNNNAKWQHPLNNKPLIPQVKWIMQWNYFNSLESTYFAIKWYLIEDLTVQGKLKLIFLLQVVLINAENLSFVAGIRGSAEPFGLKELYPICGYLCSERGLLGRQ